MRIVTAAILSTVLTVLLVGAAEQDAQQRAPSAAPARSMARSASGSSRAASQASSASSSRRSHGGGMGGSHGIGRLRPEKLTREVTNGVMQGTTTAARLVGGGLVGSKGKLQRAKTFAEQGRYMSSANEVGTVAGKAVMGLAGACAATVSATAAVVGGLATVVQHGSKAAADSIDNLINHENTYQARQHHRRQLSMPHLSSLVAVT